MRNPPLAWATDSEALLHWDEVGTVLVRNGQEIIVSPLEGVEDSLVVHVVQGAAMGIALHQRGLFTLHSSAVAIDGGVVAFIAEKGWGKSTTAAALHARDYPIVTDDILALRFDNGAVEVVPGTPHFKLYPDSITASLDEDPEEMPRISVFGTKRVRTLTDRCQLSALPLRCIYVLDYSPRENQYLAIEAVSPGTACIELIRHSYALRFLDQAATTQHLGKCAELVRSVPIRCIKREHVLSQMPRLVSLIEEDLACLDTGAAVTV